MSVIYPILFLVAQNFASLCSLCLILSLKFTNSIFGCDSQLRYFHVKIVGWWWESEQRSSISQHALLSCQSACAIEPYPKNIFHNCSHYFHYTGNQLYFDITFLNIEVHFSSYFWIFHHIFFGSMQTTFKVPRCMMGHSYELMWKKTNPPWSRFLVRPPSISPIWDVLLGLLHYVYDYMHQCWGKTGISTRRHSNLQGHGSVTLIALYTHRLYFASALRTTSSPTTSGWLFVPVLVYQLHH